MTTITSCDSETLYIAALEWGGFPITLDGGTMGCLHNDIGVVHHVGDDGRHHCPTGAIMCYDCGAVGEEPGEPRCTK